MRKSDFFVLFIALNITLLLMMGLHALSAQESAQLALQEKGTLVRQLELTDLCLFTDARYTRHPAMADLHSAFQDMPMSFDHFPSGSIMPPPPHLRSHAKN